MTTILIVRHGFSESNKLKTFTGHIDAPLSDVGVEQARLTCNYIAENYAVDKVYSSDLSRAVNTLKPLADALGLEIIKEKGLREIYGGKWEGVAFDQLPKLFPEDYKVWQENVGIARCTGGESYPESQKRVVETLYKIAQQEEGNTIAVATHGGLIRGLECYLLGIPLEEMSKTSYVQNASISVIVYDGETFTLIERDIVKHLNGLCTAMGKGI